MSNKLNYCLQALKRRLNEQHELEVYHEGGHIWTAGFEWNRPADQTSIRALQKSIGVKLPKAYIEFLLIHDGAVLFSDMQYGQWGIILYGTSQLVKKQQYWQEIYSHTWRENYVVFGESLGDTDILVFDMNQATIGRQDVAVIDGDAGYLPTDWNRISFSFEDWLDHLFVAQGSKFWRWK